MITPSTRKRDRVFSILLQKRHREAIKLTETQFYFKPAVRNSEEIPKSRCAKKQNNVFYETSAWPTSVILKISINFSNYWNLQNYPNRSSDWNSTLSGRVKNTATFYSLYVTDLIFQQVCAIQFLNTFWPRYEDILPLCKRTTIGATRAYCLKLASKTKTINASAKKEEIFRNKQNVQLKCRLSAKVLFGPQLRWSWSHESEFVREAVRITWINRRTNNHSLLKSLLSLGQLLTIIAAMIATTLIIVI